ncbi:RagB/SusD family protein [Belliella baltica DSM 15883]|uniref:RagB/SusD family protein n=1 Tax=Belliella baltica (strain DSM 15883 / CIP 108006 / LMG 21964 / BA134) TaxID=866536 RepID=I3Z2Z0_BELBD|nr:RagB/SusD family nutrient uptake outer membrane protein [Belliella baltica]AFL83608.1 RagB/SusD family protein [Belliella baltica DSM 15883]
MKNKLYFLLSLILLTSCEEFLDVKPEKSLLLPETLTDLQGLLDSDALVMNITPALQIAAADELLPSPQGWNAIPEIQRNAFIWADDMYEGALVGDWNRPFEQIFYANVVLERLEQVQIKPNEKAWKEEIKGAALFFRAHAYFQLSQMFMPPYSTNVANEPLGMPLRDFSDVSTIAQRSTVQQTYQFMLQDLNEAMELLPSIAQFKNRPSRQAAFALLARIYLAMGDYPNAEQYADLCLEIDDTLMDYNEINPSPARPFQRFNSEVIFNANSVIYTFSVFPTIPANPELLSLYEEEDLRSNLFFAQPTVFGRVFRGSYMGNLFYFTGIAVDEVVLISSEAKARTGKSEEALELLNYLLSNRVENGSFQEVHGISDMELLERILLERRKQLAFRGLRWSDIRRLASSPITATELNKEIAGESYVLPINSPKYAFQIPDDELQRSGLSPNPR